MTRVVAVILARMGSNRLPGKPLLPLQDTSVLACIVSRLQRTELRAVRPILATSSDTTDDVLVRAGQDLGIDVFRGDRDDVLSRFVGAAKAYDASYAARVNADSPLVEPRLLCEALDVLQVSERTPIFVTSKPNRHLPYGVSAEVVSIDYLEGIHASCAPNDREHITSALYRDLHRSDIAHVGASLPERPDLSLAVDTLGDLRRVNTLIRESGLNAHEVAYWDLPMTQGRASQ